MPQDNAKSDVVQPVGRMQGDAGVSAVFVSITFVVLVIIAALVTDLGLAYAGGRAMQNGADSAAMRATRQLLKYKQNPYNPLTNPMGVRPGTVLAEANTGVQQGGGDLNTCEIIRNDATRSTIGACSIDLNVMNPDAGGVRLNSHGTTPTMFGKALNYSKVDATRVAAATVQKLLTGSGPFYVCGGGQRNNGGYNFGLAPGDPLASLLLMGTPWPPLPPPDPPTVYTPVPAPTTANGLVGPDVMSQYPAARFIVNPAAIGTVYYIHGPGPTIQNCGAGSMGWSGVSNNLPMVLPNYLTVHPGDMAGPTRTNAVSQAVCGSGLSTGCVLFLPLCPGSNGLGGRNFLVYCVTWGAFEIVAANANQHWARFLGGATAINGQGGLGAFDPNAGNVVKLVQ